MIVDVAADAWSELEQWIRDERRFGSIEVLDVDVSIDEDATGERAVFFDLTLSDPVTGEDSWPLDDVLDLHRRVDARAADLLGDERWHVRLRPLTDDVTDDEE